MPEKDKDINKLELSEKPIIKKRTRGEKIRDGLKAIGDYIWGDIIEPAIKDTLANSAKSAVDMALFGESRADDYRRRDDRTNYNRISSSVTSYSRTRDPVATRRREESYRKDRERDLDDIVFQNRSDAEKLLDYMNDQIREYGQVYMGDLYSAIGVDSGFTDYSRGWESLQGAYIDRYRGGYRVVLPIPRVLK